MPTPFDTAWQELLQRLAQPAGHGGIDASAVLRALAEDYARDPARWQAAQQAWYSEQQALWQQCNEGKVAALDDKRFRADAWQQPYFNWLAQSYVATSRWMTTLADSTTLAEHDKKRAAYLIRQWVHAASPANFAWSNPEALKLAADTQGASLARGLENLRADLPKGLVSMTDRSAFTVGKNLAVTPGAVVFENELMQLIQYRPSTERVHQRPLLMVPPCINKFYILDLQPENSFIRYSVAQGHRTFVVSWRNPDQSHANVTWDDYVENVAIKAIEVVREIGASPQINALGFCVGGTILTNALAVLAARKLDWVASTTLLTTLVDFSDTGVLDVFIDENFVRFREMQFANGGLMAGRDMAQTFSFLRPNDLVWNYVVGNYLKGETPPPFDLLYWNSDSTNLPGPLYAWYLRNTYLENRLIRPGTATVCGEKIDFNRVKMPFYIYGSREDHIVPIGGAYASTQVFPGKKRFMMGASGHIAGVINPPAAKKRSHWVRNDGKYPVYFNDWMAGAKETPGSWWADWSGWLKGHAGKMIAAPKSYGRGKYKAIEAAPGRYVKAKIGRAHV